MTVETFSVIEQTGQTTRGMTADETAALTARNGLEMIASAYGTL